jgi:hypothetical protein
VHTAQVHFKGASGQKTAEQEARQHAELMKSLPEGTKVDAAMLRVATDMQMVFSKDIQLSASNDHANGRFSVHYLYIGVPSTLAMGTSRFHRRLFLFGSLLINFSL